VVIQITSLNLIKKNKFDETKSWNNIIYEGIFAGSWLQVKRKKKIKIDESLPIIFSKFMKFE